MTLNDRVTNDMKEAMKAGQAQRLSTLRSLRAQLVELSKRGTAAPITPEDELGVLSSAVKKRKEAIELYEQAGRTDLATNERNELEIINSYLPAQLSRDELASKIDALIASTNAAGPRDFGKVMGIAMKELKGRAEGSLIQELVKQKLGG